MNFATIEQIQASVNSASESAANFFYAGKSGYCMRHRDRWIPLPAESQVRQHMLMSGVAKADLPMLLCHVRSENFVDHLGPLAGHPPGVHDNPDTGGKLLVTVGPTIIPSAPGPYSTITRILRELLDDADHPDQFKACLGWLRQARENVKACTRRPLPALALVGPRGCGKTLFIEVVRLALGGRSACCYDTLSGGRFTGGIVGSELLTVDDKAASSDNRTRTRIAQNIKNMLFATSANIESKFRDATTCRPVWSMIIAVNNEAEHLGVLPVLDDSMRDKVSLISCSPADVSDFTREELGEAIASEMPGFLHELEKYELPEHLRDTRTGAKAFWHPSVLGIVHDISNERRLLDLVRQCFGVADSGSWSGTADELQGLLAKDMTTKDPAKQLLSWGKACGTYLSRLTDDPDSGVTKGPHRAGIATYTVTMPANNGRIEAL